MRKMWSFWTPFDSVNFLACDSGFKGELQPDIHPTGRRGKSIIIPDGTFGGASLDITHVSKVPVHLRGILDYIDETTVVLGVDDGTLQNAGPTPPPPDEIDLSKAFIYKSPVDIAAWPVTLQITGLQMSHENGFAFSFNRVVPDSWKWYTGNPHDPTDNYQYTVWPVVFINGKWYTSGIVQMWQGRPSTGEFGMPTWHEDFHANWCYNASWGEMFNYFPTPEDRFGFFVSAGNARDEKGVTSVRERSDVIEIILPVGDEGSWNF